MSLWKKLHGDAWPICLLLSGFHYISCCNKASPWKEKNQRLWIKKNLCVMRKSQRRSGGVVWTLTGGIDTLAVIQAGSGICYMSLEFRWHFLLDYSKFLGVISIKFTFKVMRINMTSLKGVGTDKEVFKNSSLEHLANRPGKSQG